MSKPLKSKINCYSVYIFFVYQQSKPSCTNKIQIVEENKSVYKKVRVEGTHVWWRYVTRRFLD